MIKRSLATPQRNPSDWRSIIPALSKQRHTHTHTRTHLGCAARHTHVFAGHCEAAYLISLGFPCLQFMLVGNTKGAMSNALGKVGSVVKGAKAMAQAKLEQTRVRCLRSVARCLQAMHPYLSHLHAHVEGSTRHRLHASLAYFACDCAVDGRVFPHTALHLVISFMRHARGAFQNLMAT